MVLNLYLLAFFLSTGNNHAASSLFIRQFEAKFILLSLCLDSQCLPQLIDSYESKSMDSIEPNHVSSPHKLPSAVTRRSLQHCLVVLDERDATCPLVWVPIV